MIVDLLIFPFVCFLEWVCKGWFRFWRIAWWTVKVTAWLIIVPAWDMVVLGFQIMAWIICKIFKQRTPRLKWGKHLMIYSTWE